MPLSLLPSEAGRRARPQGACAGRRVLRGARRRTRPLRLDAIPKYRVPALDLEALHASARERVRGLPSDRRRLPRTIVGRVVVRRFAGGRGPEF